MLYTIKNDQIEVQVAGRGAEMMSLKKVNDDYQYLWQGDETFWASRASNLFPICGRLTEGKYTYEGKTYEMILHGFSRFMEMTPVEQTETTLALQLVSNEETLKQYPFHFTLTIRYELEGNTVKQTFIVKNNDEKKLPFAVGGHPGFNIPMTPGTCFEDYYIEFACEKPVRQLVMSPTCYDTGERVPFALEDGKKLYLRHDLFDNDAIFLTDMCKKVTLRSDKSDRSVTLYYPDMNFLGLWHKPHTQAPYMCIEPWYGVPAYDGIVDDFETKHMMMHMPSGEEYQNTIEITIA